MMSKESKKWQKNSLKADFKRKILAGQFLMECPFRRVSNVDNAMLIAPFTIEEFKEVI